MKIERSYLLAVAGIVAFAFFQGWLLGAAPLWVICIDAFAVGGIIGWHLYDYVKWTKWRWE